MAASDLYMIRSTDLEAGGSAADRLSGVRGAPGDHTDHRHGHQPGEEPGRRRALQPARELEATRKIHDMHH